MDIHDPKVATSTPQGVSEKLRSDKIGDGPNTVLKRTVANTELSSESLLPSPISGENSVSSSQPRICVQRCVFRRTHRV